MFFNLKMNGKIPELNSSPHPAFGFKEQTPAKSEGSTFRFECDLTASENGYAEVNFKQLMAKAVKEQKLKNGEELGSADGTFEDSVAFDGVNYGKVIGYDTDDSFIDDSELFDEYVHPVPGGFCINNNKKGKTKKTDKPLQSKNAPEVSKNDIKIKKVTNKDVPKTKKFKKNDDDIEIINEVIRTPLKDNTNKTSKQPVQNKGGVQGLKNGNMITQNILDHNNPSLVAKSCHVLVKPIITKKQAEEKCPDLPSNLPSDLLKCIEVLKVNKILLKSGKIDFNENLKCLLQELEWHLFPFNAKIRSDIFAHISHYLSVPSKTLKKKSKLFMIRKLNSDLEILIEKLCREIKKTKSESSESQHSSIIYDNISSSQSIESVSNKSFQDSFISSLSRPSLTITPINSPNSSTNSTQTNILTSVIKDLLLKIFRLKKQLYDIHRSKTKSFCEELFEYIKEDISYLWLPTHQKLDPLFEFAKEFSSSLTVSLSKKKVADNSTVTKLQSNPNMSITCMPLVNNDMSVATIQSQTQNIQAIKKMQLKKNQHKMLKAESCLKPKKSILKKINLKPKVLTKEQLEKLPPELVRPKDCYVKTQKVNLEVIKQQPKIKPKDASSSIIVGKGVCRIAPKGLVKQNPIVTLTSNRNVIELGKPLPNNYSKPSTTLNESPKLTMKAPFSKSPTVSIKKLQNDHLAMSSEPKLPKLKDSLSRPMTPVVKHTTPVIYSKNVQPQRSSSYPVIEDRSSTRSKEFSENHKVIVLSKDQHGKICSQGSQPSPK